MRSSVQVKEINSQSFLSFKKVRQMESSLYGKYFLYSKNGFKYIGKHLSKDYQLVSYRNTAYPVLKYKGKEDCIYLFPLHGQQVLNFMSKTSIDGEIKRWVQKNITLENCLWEIVRLVSNLIQKKKLTQILVECLRIHNGQLQYCYDSWMNQSHTIVFNNQNQLENYYFSQQDLDRLRQIIDFPQSDNLYEFQVSMKSLYFRLFMMVLHLGTMNLKQRNYQYGYYQVHKQHLKIRLDYFCSRYNAKNLGTLTKMIIEEQNYDINQVSKICLPETLEQKQNQTVNSNSFNSMYMVKSRKRAAENEYQTHSPIKISQIGKLNTSYISNISHNSIEEDNKFFLERSIVTNNKRSHLKVREQNMQDATMKSSVFSKSKYNISFESQQSTGKVQAKKINEPNKSKVYKVCNSVSKKQPFNLRNILNQKSEIPQSGTKVLKYFNLDQYVPENKYQEHILKVLQKIHVKNNWIKQFYENGSIYFGQMVQNKKSGKGMYLFNSNDFYFGGWAENYMEGYGSYIFASGQIYEGELKKGFKQGHGKCIYEDGRQYEGSWFNNSKIGLGKVSFPNQVVFIGLFKPQVKETQGLFIGPLDQNGKPLWQNKGILQYYHWQKNLILNDKNEQIERKAKLMTYASQNYTQIRDDDGSLYEGQMNGGVKQGFGILQSQKQKYEGQWHKGYKHGQGTLFVKNMFSLKGKWKDNIMVEYFYDENEDI